MLCVGGDCEPIPTVNGRRLAGARTSCAVVETKSLTGIVSGLFTAGAPVAGMVAVMVIVPSHVAAVVKPAVATDTTRVSSVKPLMALVPLFNSNQLPQVVV